MGYCSIEKTEKAYSHYDPRRDSDDSAIDFHVFSLDEVKNELNTAVLATCHSDSNLDPATYIKNRWGKFNQLGAFYSVPIATPPARDVLSKFPIQTLYW